MPTSKNTIPIATIEVGTRRRRELGNITALARSIKKYGLIHPIVVDDGNLLVAGGRRLAACQQLGWTEIAITTRENLSENQRREIELEENLQRLDLTSYESALTIVQLAKAAKAAAKEEETCADSAHVSKGKRGPAKTPGSTRDLATRTGIPDTTRREAEAHVALAQRFPSLQAPAWKQSSVMALAEAMEPLPKDQQDLAMGLIEDATNEPKKVVELARNIAEMKPAARAEVWRDWASDDSRDRARAQTLAAKTPPMPDPRVAILKEVVADLRKCVALFPNDELVPSLKDEIEHVTRLKEAIKK